MISTIKIKTNSREEIIDITSIVSKVVKESGKKNGLLFCYVPHTTCAITINENADPDVKSDIISKLKKVFPQNDDYLHIEGNSDSHIKSSLIGFSEQVIIENGNLVLGTWQGIQFCEFDGPRDRKLIIKIIADD